jgi:ABC-type antimicrobial peptide transport system permease subunit
MVLVLLGAIVGIAPGYYGAVWAAGQISEDIGIDLELGFDGYFAIRALLWVLVMGALFAMYPAYVAVRMNIVRAISSTH